MPDYPTPDQFGYLTSKYTLSKLMKSIETGKPCTPFRIEGIDGGKSTIRGRVVCIQEKGISNPDYEDVCRLIFTMELEEPKRDIIRFLYVTEHGEEDHIHFEDHAIKCPTTERRIGWPELPEIKRTRFQ